MGVVPPIDVSIEQYRTILTLLRQYLPKTSAWAYGSRAKWTSSPHSDLDLVVFAEPGQHHQVGELREAFEESNLPFRVDLFVWDDIPDSFRKNVREQHIELMPGREETSNSIGAVQPRATAEEISKKITGWLFCPSFPTHWQQGSLYSMAIWINGLAFRNIQFSDTGLPVIKIAEIKGGISGQTKFTEQVFDESVLVRSGDLLFSWSGQPETSIDAFWWRGSEGWLNQHIFKVIPVAGIDNDFFYYLLRYLKPNFIGIARNKQTTGLGHVTKRDLENLRAAYPALPEQRTIAHILGTLDEKIELNQKINKTLEEIAKSIFKSWFVDFDPVRAKAEGRPTGLPSEISDLFPDELVDSEIGKMPKEWMVLSLDEMGIFRNGLALQKYPASEDSEPLPVVKIAQLRKGNTKSDNVFASNIPDEFVIDDGDFIFSWSGSLLAKYWVGGKGALNQHLFKVEEKMAPLWFVANWVHQHMSEFRSIAQSKATTMGHIKREHLNQAKCVVPTKSVMSVAEKVISPLIERGIFAQKESKTLENLRDALLPKLISGELRVPDPEKFLKEANI